MNATKESLLVGVDDVATLLRCSARHVWALTAAGKMPQPIRLGRAVRWNLNELRLWIDAGAPNDWQRSKGVSR